MNQEIILEIFAKRLNELVSDDKNDLSFLLDKIGIKSKSTVYRYMNAEMSPKLSTVKIIADFYNVDPVWLMGYDVPKKKVNKSFIEVQVYGTIPAGIPVECIEDIQDTEEISIDSISSNKQYFGLKVKGNSMLPDYKDGDTLILEKTETCESGDDCVVMINGNDGTFKRVFKNEESNTITLQPLNTTLGENGKPIYPVLTFNSEQIEKLPVRILGKVVELRRNFKRKK